MKKLNLDALITTRHQIESAGQTYDVRPITGAVASLIDSASEAEGVAKLRLYYDAAARIVPDMQRAAIDDLTVGQVMAIIELASDQVGAVEEAAADPNATGSAPMAVTEPIPAPAT